MQNRSILSDENEIEFGAPETAEDTLLELLCSVGSEGFNRRRIESDGAAAAIGLWLGPFNLVTDDNQGAMDSDSTCVEVDVFPTQSCDLTATHPGGRRKEKEREEAIILDVGQEGAELIGAPSPRWRCLRRSR